MAQRQAAANALERIQELENDGHLESDETSVLDDHYSTTSSDDLLASDPSIPASVNKEISQADIPMKRG